MTSEQRLQKLRTDDVNSPHLGQGGSSDWPCGERNLLQPIRSTIPHLGNGTSSVWNFSARSSGVISRGITLCRLVFRLRRLRSSEILVSRSGRGKTKQITWHGNEQCDCRSRSLLLLTPTTWFSLVRKRNRNAKSESERDRW